MSLSKTRIEQIKTECLSATVLAMQDYKAETVGELHQRAILAASESRGNDELAYVTVSIDNDDDADFTVLVDLTSGQGDAFRIDFDVVPTIGGFTTKFTGSGTVDEI